MAEDDPLSAAIAAAQAKAAATFSGSVRNVVPMRAGPKAGEGVLCVSLAQFLADTTTPDWVVDGIIQRGNLYALTAPTNHGKTAVSMVMAVAIAAGVAFGGRAAKVGRVLILCGENQDGFRLRLMATMVSMGVDIAAVSEQTLVVPFAAAIESLLPKIQVEATKFGELSFVLVDTSVSYFSGADENDNVAAYQHAAALRALTLLPGKPAVVANCHPSNSADRDRCVPRGGGAFLNEIDTNLIVFADGRTAELHWSTKKRGPDFDPMFFEYKARYVEQHGTQVPTIVASHIDEYRQKEIRLKQREHGNRLLRAMLDEPDGTIRDWAGRCGFVTGQQNHPHTSHVARLLGYLKELQLVANNRRDGWHLTKSGKEEAKTIR